MVQFGELICVAYYSIWSIRFYLKLIEQLIGGVEEAY